MSNSWEKLIVALDLEDKDKIIKVVEALSGRGVKFKIGSIAFTKFGPRFLSDIIKEKVDVFLDLKLYDIPNTMKRTASVIAQLGCWAFTVHLQAGEKALAAVKEEVVNVSKQRGCRLPLILGVTILTSSQSVDSDVDGLVGLADKVGIDGVIASARDARRIKSNYPDIKVVTPGIRNTGDDIGDQLRITTAQVAFEAGVDYIVVGRPIINEDNYLDAAKHLLEG